MKITNEISNNFELLAGSKNGEADLSILSGLFSIDFGEGSLDDKVKKIQMNLSLVKIKSNLLIIFQI